MESCEAADAIHRAFPDLEEAPVRALKQGWSYWTFAHGDRVFRFPRTANDAGLMNREIRLLPAIAPHLPVPIPVPRWIGEWQGRPFAGYPAIEGRGLRRDVLFGPGGGAIARDIGAFLTALHNSPLEQAAEAFGMLLPHHLPTPADWLESIRMRVFPRLSATLRVAVDSGFTRYARDRLDPPPHLIHHDLGFEHLLEHEGRLAGVIDFGDADLGDPAMDFVGLLAEGGWHAVDDVVRFYDRALGRGFHERVEFCYWTAPLHDIIYGLDTGEERYVGSGRSALAQRMREVGILPAAALLPR